MDVCNGFFNTAVNGQLWILGRVGEFGSCTICADSLFTKASKIYMVLVGIDVEKLDSGPKVIHELSQSPRGHSPVVWSFAPVEFCVYRNGDLEWKAMGGSKTISEHNSGNESALNAFAILYGNVTLLDECLSLGITLTIDCRPVAKERDESPDIQRAIESFAVLTCAVILITREELVCGELEACIGGL
jgi:hypothetical protein